MNALLFSLSALCALLPATALALARGPAPDADARTPTFWAVTAVAVAGTVAWSWALHAAGWRTGFSATLWVTVAATAALFAALSAAAAAAARLLPLLAPYLLILAALATLWGQAPARSVSEAAPAAWLGLHIAVSVATYALFTLAAVAGLAVALQERALKARRPTRLTAALPAVAEGERLQIALMGAAALVLGLGLATGTVVQVIETGAAIVVTHKTLFAVLAFAVICALLAAQWRSGLAGRRIARAVLVAYLLLTLAYPGVKFVTDVLLG